MQTNSIMITDKQTHQHHSSNYFSDANLTSNHFDNRLDELVAITKDLIINKGVFHLAIHFSSSQLICWTFDNPYSYQIYQAEEIFSDGFMHHFASLELKLHSDIKKDQVLPILKSLRTLREQPNGSELRNASIHMINGYIGVNFSCDDTRYINFKDFQLL